MKLRMLEEKDIESMLEWMHDPQIYCYFRFPCEENTVIDAKEFINKSKVDFANNIHRHYAIVDEQDEYLGTISLKNIDFKSNNAEYAISLRRIAQGKGIATQATYEVLKIAFEELGLQKVYLNVLSDNKNAIRLYEKCGFVKEGEFREHILIRERVHSLSWYGILKYEYYKEQMRGVSNEYNAK